MISVYIPQVIKTQSTGDNDSVAQAFSQNYFVKELTRDIVPTIFDVPAFRMEGGTIDYYSNTPDSLSYNLNNGKEYIIIFTANTQALSGITRLNHELYQITFEDFNDAKLAANLNGSTEKIARSINNPFVTFVDVSSGATGVAALTTANRYEFTFPSEIKQENAYTINLFKDKAQYFINPVFVFPKNNNLTIGAIQTFSGTPESAITIVDYYTESYEMITTDSSLHVITGNTVFSGTTVKGLFFTYFVPPKEPNLYVSQGNRQIAVQGVQNTFSPTFNFSNVDDGDYYELLVTYDITDTTFSGPTVTSFPINKQIGDAEFVRTFSVPLSPNKELLYKIGNTKEIINIFGVKQSITKYSDYINITTANDGQYNLSGHTFKNYINFGLPDSGGIITGATFLSAVTLSLQGLASNSSVVLKIDAPISETTAEGINTFLDASSIPTSSPYSTSILTTTSDSDGYFSFGRIDGGTYNLRVVPPAEYSTYFPEQNITINVTTDTNIDVILSIIWGNTILDFTTPETFL